MSSNRTKLWRKHDGTMIRVCDIDTEQLRLVVRFRRRFACAVAKAEGTTWEDYVPEIYWDIVDELKDRDVPISV